MEQNCSLEGRINVQFLRSGSTSRDDKYLCYNDIKLGFHKSENLHKPEENITCGLPQSVAAIKHNTEQTGTRKINSAFIDHFCSSSSRRL